MRSQSCEDYFDYFASNFSVLPQDEQMELGKRILSARKRLEKPDFSNPEDYFGE